MPPRFGASVESAGALAAQRIASTRYAVVGVKRAKADFVHALPDASVEPAGLLVVWARRRRSRRSRR